MTPAQHLLNHMKTLADASDHRMHEWEGGVAIDTGTVAPGNHYIINTESFSQSDMGFISYFFDSEAPVIWFQGTAVNPSLKQQLSNIDFQSMADLTGLECDLTKHTDKQDYKIQMRPLKNKSDYDEWCQAFSEVWHRDVEQTLIFFKGFSESNDIQPYLVFVEDKIVGGCCLDLSDGNAGFYWDYILPKYRKKGYGAEMIQWRLSDAKKQGAHTAFAQCLQSSIGVYKRCGFESTQPMHVFKRIS